MSKLTPPAANDVLDNYELIEKIGEGGMGSVWKARHVMLNKQVAIKILTSHISGNPGAVIRFEREMRAAGQVEHPNVVRATDAGACGGTLYLVMEYIEGVDLSKYIQQIRRCSVLQACRIIRDTALGLEAAHAKGLIHRDVKPSNIMLSSNGKAKLLDLGLARLLEEEHETQQLTQNGQVMGTPDFMAPEQWQDAHSIDHRADIYALGCTLFYLIAGFAPFGDTSHSTLGQKIKAHLLEIPTPLREFCPSAPEELDQLYFELMAKDASLRPSSAKKVADRLQGIIEKLNDLPAEKPPDEATLAYVPVAKPSTDETSDGQALLPTEEIQLGEYLILDKIGAGSMGQVYRAKHRMMDREVAIKILPNSLSRKSGAIERFYSEVRTQAKLWHPNIVTAFDAGCQEVKGEKTHYLVMELIQGVSLAHRITTQGPLSNGDISSILVQAASALQYAHMQGVVHRNIKPGNMMLTADGTLKFLDFGLAFLPEVRAFRDESISKSVVGTAEFPSPEQINLPERVDHRGDLYSLGATLYYMVTGESMPTSESMQTALPLIRRPVALKEIRQDIDIRLDSVFQWLVTDNVQERCQSAQDLLEQLYELNLMERPGASVSQRSESIRPKRLGLDFPTSLGRGTANSSKAKVPIGIELGMIHSRVSFVNSEHKVEEIQVDGESPQLRNMLFSDAERIAIGSRAVAQRVQRPDQIFYGLQRWYGLPMLERTFGGCRICPEVLVAAVIRHLIAATRHREPNASHAVVTIPGCYDQFHRISTRTACAIAGIEVLQLLEKPLAAALAHIEIESRLASARGDEGWKKTMLVVMLSGSACEASVVRADLGGVQKLSLVGDWKRGTLRWQDRAAKRLASLIESRYGLRARANLNLASQIQRTIESAMERLRHATVVPFIFDMPKGRYENALYRDRIQEWVGDLASDCGTFAADALRRANLDPSAIDSLLLIGDVRWLDKIRQPLKDLIKPGGQVIEIKTADLARGAALQAKYLMPPIDPHYPLAKSATSYDLGMIVQDERSKVAPHPKVLIPKDSSVPTDLSRTLRFTREGTRQPVLQWVEGSRFGEHTWHKLSSVDLQTCFEGRTNADPIQLRAEIDASGMWSGSLTWLAGNKQLTLPPLAEPVMDSVATRQWHDWLDSIMPCNV